MTKFFTILIVSYLVFFSSPEACGPRRVVPIFYSRDGGQYGGNDKYSIYGDITKPYIELKSYAQGNLGVIRPQYSVIFLWLAYRNLTNKPLLPKEIDLLLKLEKEGNYFHSHIDWKEKWVEACESTLQQKQEPVSGYTSATIQKDGKTELLSFENCTDSAFQHAVNRLKDLEKNHGDKSEIFLQWVCSQQQVFKNCKGGKIEATLPEPLHSNATEEQRHDYEYQVASSYFYVMDYKQSAKLFEAIANNTKSPYKDIALYLVLRSLFRDVLYKNGSKKAFTESYERLKTVIEQSTYKDDIKGLYNHIRFADNPAEIAGDIIDELSKELKTPLLDELRYLALSQRQLLEGDKKLNNEFWEWRRLLKSKDSYREAFEYWKKTSASLWLIVVLEKIPHDCEDVAELIKAARAIPESSPAYLTVSYQLAKLYLLKGDKDSAKEIIDKVLSLPLSLSTKNRFLDLKASFAKSYLEFLEDILQEPVDRDKDDIYTYNPFAPFFSPEDKINRPLDINFDWEHFSKVQKVSIASLKQVSETASILKKERDRFLIAAWVRCVLLDLMDEAKEIALKLMEIEPKLKESLILFRNESNSKRQHYIAHLLILRYPGFSLFVYPYAWRNNPTNWRSNGLDLSKIDTKSGLRENWWKDSVLKEVADAPMPGFISREEAIKVDQEFKLLKEKIPLKTDYFCKLVIEWFKEMPEDTLVPEMMHRCVQMSRFTYAPKSSYEVFELLHKHFKNNEHAKKTPYHYWHKGVSEIEGD